MSSHPAPSRRIDTLPVWAGTLNYVNVGGANFIPYWEDGSAGTQTTMYRVPSAGGGSHGRVLVRGELVWGGALLR
jgi:hypothetical protein